MKRILIFLLLLGPLFSIGQKQKKLFSSFLEGKYVKQEPLTVEQYHAGLTALLTGNGSKYFVPGAKQAIQKHIQKTFAGYNLSIQQILEETVYYPVTQDLGFKENVEVSMLDLTDKRGVQEYFHQRPAYPDEHIGVHAPTGIVYTSAACGNNLKTNLRFNTKPKEEEKPAIAETFKKREREEIKEEDDSMYEMPEKSSKKDWVQIMQEKNPASGDIYIKNVLKNEAGATPAVSAQNGNSNSTPTIIFMQVPQQPVAPIPMPVTTVKKNNGLLWGVLGGAILTGATICIVKKLEKDRIREIPQVDDPGREIKPGDRPDRPKPPTDGGDDDFQGPGGEYNNGWRIRFSGRMAAPAAPRLFLGGGGIGLRFGL